MRLPGRAVLCTAVAGAIAAAAPATAGAHGGGYGDGYGNCLSYLSTAQVESYAPAGIRVLNRTRRRDRQTIYWRASLIYYGHHRYPKYLEPFSIWRWGYGEWFRTTVKERPGRRRTTPYWAQDSTGDVRAWGTRWVISTEVSSYIEVTLIWKQRGRTVHSHVYRLPSLNYPIPPSNNRSWAEWCYRYNGGYTAFFHPASYYTVYFPNGRTSNLAATASRRSAVRAGKPRTAEPRPLD